ncbi:HutD/Ves family protein [Streptomyces sp. NBC_00691]|uniref:HutD/Ves family protein n=1 Tax=Streptomyces sp. NBC_00691 TaxID=2903671 RepID=UPI002E325FDC|nr:HutD family protein [Streptomyces sp. NBC_00691]
MHHFDVETLTPGRWRNGGGATREIASRPVGTAGFGWRASVADIDRAGPFSVFPGVDRTLTLLAGEGVLLTCPGTFERLPARAGVPVEFSGDLTLSAELSGGACRVLNIMVRRGRWTARVRRVTSRIAPPSGHAGLLYVMHGRWQPGEDGQAMASGQGVWWSGDDDAPGESVSPLSPDAEALWADLTPTG